MDGSQRLAWLEDYAAALVQQADRAVPNVLREGIRVERVSFAYPGTSRLVLDDVSLTLPAGAVVESALVTIRTGCPAVTRWVPSTTTRSPATRPLSITQPPPSHDEADTVRARAVSPAVTT